MGRGQPKGRNWHYASLHPDPIHHNRRRPAPLVCRVWPDGQHAEGPFRAARPHRPAHFHLPQQREVREAGDHRGRGLMARLLRQHLEPGIKCPLPSLPSLEQGPKSPLPSLPRSEQGPKSPLLYAPNLEPGTRDRLVIMPSPEQGTMGPLATLTDSHDAPSRSHS